MDALHALKGIFLFRDVPEPILQLVAQCVEQRTVPAGETIASEGQSIDALYLVRNGSIRAHRSGEATFIVMGPGQSFGQMALVDGGPVGLSAVAVERTDLLVLRAERLREKLAGNHEAGHVLFRAVAKSLAARLRQALDALALAGEGPGGAKR
jgi:CRP-like cAMP-binding protein